MSQHGECLGEFEGDVGCRWRKINGKKDGEENRHFVNDILL